MKAGARIRTADLLITNQLLYRLSYASIDVGVGFYSEDKLQAASSKLQAREYSTGY